MNLTKNEERTALDLHCSEKYISFIDHFLWRGCSSVVEHLPFKQRVDGSSPSSLTKKYYAEVVKLADTPS